MTPNEVLRLYLALKLHFTTEYDYFKYDGKLKYKVNYEKRRDKWQIAKLAKHPDPFGVLLANLVKDSKIWIGDISSPNGLKVYTDWKKRQDALGYYFCEEVRQFAEVAKEPATWYPVDGQHPLLLRRHLADKVSLDTMIIVFDVFHGLLDGLWGPDPEPVVPKIPHETGDEIQIGAFRSRAMSYDPVWLEVRHKMNKYKQFMKYDLKKFYRLFLQNINEDEE